MSIVFILGNPRSGTSLLRLVLNAHPRISAPPECGFVQWNHASFAERDFSDPAARHDLARAVHASRKFETWELDVDALTRAFDAVETATYESLCESVYRAYGRARGKPDVDVVVDKNNYYVEDPGAIARAAPSSRFVHIVRDGRDVACSYRAVQHAGHGGAYAPRLTEDVDRIASEWTANNERVVEFLGSLDGTRSICVRYEDVVRDFEPTLRSLAEFLGVDVDPAMARFHELNDEPEATLDWKRKTLGPLDPSTVGRHRRDLSNEERARFESIAGRTLERFGYRCP